MSELIRGTCTSMCPQKERWMREKEGLLHRFEIDESTRGLRRPRADVARVVKSFSRPAAGQNMTDPDQLRPGPVLLMTVKYLFNNIVPRADVDWTMVYDFVFDRLRAIRQDIVIQRIGCAISIQLYELIVRFLVYAGQRLCERGINEFDTKINNQHLTECIKHLLVLYDELDNVNPMEIHKSMEKLTLNYNRPEMEALYILLHIGDINALNRALTLPLNLRKSPEIQLAMEISFAWYLKNYVRVCKLIQRLSPIHVCAILINIRSIRRTALKIMSVGYNSKVNTFPGLKLQELLLYRDIDTLQADCELFGLSFVNQNVRFEKSTFKNDVQLSNPEMHYTHQDLNYLLPHILLGTG